MTREKEREQEQQKQKQQQQQVESMFARDNSRPYQWSTKILEKEPLSYDKSIELSSEGTKWEDAFPFYPLSIFTPRPKDFNFSKLFFPRIESLEFPQSMLQSTNFAPIGRDFTKPLKLKNVNIVLDWVINKDNNERRTVVLTLSEAESMRRFIQRVRKSGTTTIAGELALLLLPQGIVFEATQGYEKQDSSNSCNNDNSDTNNRIPEETNFSMKTITHEGGNNSILKGETSEEYQERKNENQQPSISTSLKVNIQCLKFWNNEMFYEEDEAKLLLFAFRSNAKGERRDFFGFLRARRRSRNSWTGMPIRQVFSFSDDESFNHLLSLVDQIREYLVDKNIVDIALNSIQMVMVSCPIWLKSVFLLLEFP